MMHYAVSCGDAVHTIPADSHEITENGNLTVHGREDHHYGPQDWDLVMWAMSRQELLDMAGRIKLAPRLSE